jgi:hypothetical protein
VPSFAEHWHAYTARLDYNPIDPGLNVIEFKLHLADVVGDDPESLGPLFAAMERLYVAAPSEREFLTISVLETVTKAAERHHADLRRLARLLAGPETRSAWLEALSWTHPECAWDDARGLVPRWPPPAPVGHVRVIEARPPIADLPSFALECELLDGAARPGCFMWVRLSSCCHWGREIAAVERVPSSPGSAVHLVLRLRYHDSEGPGDRPHIAEFWCEPGEVVEIIEALPPEDEVRDHDVPPVGEC